MGQLEASVRSSHWGAQAEYLAVAKLSALGHQVALPVVDDGVDMVVGRKFVQVKSAWRPNASHGFYEFDLLRKGSATNRIRPYEDIDVFLLFARDIERWWVVPTSELDLPVRRIRIRPSSARAARWESAWHLL